MIEDKFFKTTETTKMMRQFNDILYLCGLRQFWIEPETFSVTFIRIYDVISKIIHFMSATFTFLLLAAFFTQKQLDTKEKSDRFVMNSSFSICHFYCCIFIYHRQTIRAILYKLMILLKEDHNDAEVEKQTAKKFKAYIVAFTVFASMMLMFNGVYALTMKILEGTTFVTVVTAWPEARDASMEAEIARVFIYGFWWVSLFRMTSCLMILGILLIGVSQQFKNLQCYFYGLDKIFSGDSSQEEKEQIFETAFIKGIKMHQDTIWCLNETKRVCQMTFDTQMVISMVMFATLLLALMNPDHDFGTVLVNMPTAVVCLIATAFFMWNGGDVSVEVLCIARASLLPNAIYGSGWQHCHMKSISIRNLVVIAMAQAQTPVVLKALGAVQLTYNGYLKVIKMSHSVFTVMY